MNNANKSTYVKLTGSSGLSSKIDLSDLDLLSQYRWRLNEDGYAFTTIKEKTVRMHRLILGAEPGVEVDHINGDRLDNRRSNLRLCNRSEQMRNRRKWTRGRNASKYIGVSPLRGNKVTWCARIRIDGKNTHIGTFQTEELAARAYDDMARKVHGAFARLNFPNGRCFYCGTSLCDGHKDAA